MSTPQQPRAPAPTPNGDPPPEHEENVWFPPPETSEPTKTASERAPGPASAPAETEGQDMPRADAAMVSNAPSHNATQAATAYRANVALRPDACGLTRSHLPLWLHLRTRD